MNRRHLLVSALFAAIALTGIVGSLVGADAPKNDAVSAEKPAAAPQLPPGWTEADMQACVIAGTPGKMHEHLAKGVGEWSGKTTMWMYPGAEPVMSEITSKVTSLMDGRYFKGEFMGDMPGMGPYHGGGIVGFDNVSQKFVSNWIDNHSTGIMQGVGSLSEDGKTLTWTYTYNCPLTKKPATMREIQTITGPDTQTLEMWSAEPKTGKEFKMMFIELTRKPAA